MAQAGGQLIGRKTMESVAMRAIEQRVGEILARRDRGFTLIELIVVISVIVVVFSLSLPAMYKFLEDRKLKAAATLVMTTLNEARTNSVTQKRTIGVVFYQTGMRLYDFEGSTDEDGDITHFTGGLQSYQSVDDIQYRLMFADLAYEDIPAPPEDLHDESLRDNDVVLRFKSDGTIDFGPFEDVPSSDYSEARPANADIIVDFGQRPSKAWIDVRPQGRLVYKIAESKAEDE